MTDNIASLINSLLKKNQLNNNTLVLLLVHITQNKIKTTLDLVSNLLNTYVIQTCTDGYLYCFHNEVYKTYGDNVYKLGCTSNIKKRLSGYITYYIKPCTIEYQSKLVKYHSVAESMLFYKLKQYRIAPNREFFDCDLQIIKDAMSEVETEIKNTSIVDIINKYKIDNCNINIFHKSLYKSIEYFYFKLSNILGDVTICNKNIVTNNIKYSKIMGANNITENDFNELNKLSLDHLSPSKMYEVEKYVLCKICANTLNIQYLNDNYEKINKKLSYDFLTNFDIILRNSKSWHHKRDIILEVIGMLGFNIYNEKIYLDKDTFTNNIIKVVNGSQLFVNINKSQPLFSYCKLKMGGFKRAGDNPTIRQFMGFLNVLLGKWALIINVNRKSVKTRDKKVIKFHYYSLNCTNGIDMYI